MEAPATTSPRPKSPPLGSLGKELAAIQELPLTIALGLAVIVGLVGPLLFYQAVSGGLPTAVTAIPWLWLAAAMCIGSLSLATAIAAFLPSFLLSSDDRAASVAHAWIGAREVRRLFGSPTAAINIPTTPEEAETWLATQLDSAHLLPLRFEVLLMVRRFDQARAAVDRFPRSTPFEEYRAVEAGAMVDDQETGQADLTAVREALRQIPRGIDRSEATASLAVFEARRLVGHGDWRAPLVAARRDIPGSDWSILVRDMGMPIFRNIAPRVVLPIGAVIVLIAVGVTFLSLT